MSNLRIGTSGWNYPSGKGTWNGIFYPPPRRRLKGFDELTFYALARPNATDLDAFRRGIEPLASSGRLGALLAQFPPSFKDVPASRDYLTGLLRAFGGYPIAVELRHRSWSDGIGDTLSLLNTFGAAGVQIDEPKFRFSLRQNYLPNV